VRVPRLKQQPGKSRTLRVRAPLFLSLRAAAAKNPISILPLSLQEAHRITRRALLPLSLWYWLN
jgi:hypothetical protein